MSSSVLQGLGVSYSDGKWKKKAKDLANNVLKKFAAEVDKEGRFPEESMDALRQSGLLGLGIPEEFGGLGGNASTLATVVQELAKGCPSTAMSYLMHISIVPIIWRLASERQYSSMVLPIINGESLGSYSMSEKGSGSRLWHMDSFGVKNGEFFEVESFKSFATSSNHCDFYFLAVKQSEEAPSNRLNIFLVPAANPQIKIIGQWDAMGLRGTSSTPVHFNKCQVHESCMLGNPGEGYNLIMAYVFPSYILGLSSVYVGISRKAYEAAIEHIKSRSYSDTGSGLRDVESIQVHVSEMKILLDASQAFLDRIAQLTVQVTNVFDQIRQTGMLDELIENAEKDDFFLELSQLKVLACENAIKITNLALQVCGGSGYKRGTVVEQCYRDARAGSVMGPTDDILKTVIGKRVLNIPFPWKNKLEKI